LTVCIHIYMGSLCLGKIAVFDETSHDQRPPSVAILEHQHNLFSDVGAMNVDGRSRANSSRTMLSRKNHEWSMTIVQHGDYDPDASPHNVDCA